jgi:hypothetical protein
VFVDDIEDQYYLKLSKEKVRRRDNAGGLAIPNEIGFALKYYEDNIRRRVAKDNIEAFWVNMQGKPMSKVNFYKNNI